MTTEFPAPTDHAGRATPAHPPNGPDVCGPREVVILAEHQPVHQPLFDRIVDDESGRLGIRVAVRWVDLLGESSVAQAAAALPAGGHLVLVPRPDTPDLTGVPTMAGYAITRVDLVVRERDRSAAVARHIAGRGIDGIRWALRALHHADMAPAQRLAYGADPEQFGELRLPAGQSPSHHPVVVLLHGGFWQSRWQLDLMDALAVDLPTRGLASWNVEYRRPDRHGWPATVADVAAAVQLLGGLAGRYDLDPARVALVGHSAGGQLAVQLAADMLTAPSPTPPPRLVVSMAGVLDLQQAHGRDLGEGAVHAALGGTPEELPEVYASSSPLGRLPLAIDQLVVVARGDSQDLCEMSYRYVASAGARARLLEDDGDHFTVIDPASAVWARTAEAIRSTLVQAAATHRPV